MAWVQFAIQIDDNDDYLPSYTSTPLTHRKWGNAPSFVVGERGKMPAPLTHRKWGKNPSSVVAHWWVGALRLQQVLV